MNGPQFYKKEIAAKKREIIRLEESERAARQTLEKFHKTTKGKTEYDILQWEAREKHLEKALQAATDALRHDRMELKSLFESLQDSQQFKIF